ncbi:murein hydrolase activator EnvC family protein [Aquella oligotrophica]|uniref:M23ase beta-sheet core domain-containing protein n=1 Tax=Aquella oligotrophica TaxID=2067065 RepID=A0A2I7N4S1_9NEIS|nr:peptidoglycan DD-metalloendopeptidase family protein [Aquella oligotrophica]AUR51464.1 hypothetical protein CUN60_03885 [Aquella oligotrophica]
MKFSVFVRFLLVFVVVGHAFADNTQSSSVTSNLNTLNQQINSLNQDLDSKQKKKQALDSAIKTSQEAISSAESLLRKLKAERDADVAQLRQLQVSIPQIESQTARAEEYVKYSMTQIYQQIRELQFQESSILMGNASLDSERKKIYLVELLKLEQERYIKLNDKLLKLRSLNQSLLAEVKRLDDKLGDTKDMHQQLVVDKNAKLAQASSVAKQIAKEKAQLSHLKQRQVQLNKLLKQLAEAEKRQKQQAALAAKKANQQNTTTANTSSKVTQSKPDNSFEDNSPFMQRKLAKPVEGKILVGFGQKRDSVRNNGILLATKENTPIYSISGGSVLFSGELPGFGQIIVIDNGDNYTSVYSGILAKVAKGSRVSAGQTIATSGNSSNQPMGGVYFELRHLGTPVNPSKLFD